MKISPRVIRASLCGLILLPLTSLYAQSQNLCRDVLANGVREQYSVASDGDLRTAFRSALCSALGQSGEEGANADAGLTAPVKGLVDGGNAGYNGSQQRQMKTRYCGDGGSQLSDGDFGNMMESIASETVFADWSKCVEEAGRASSQDNQTGLVSDLQGEDQETLLFRTKWVPRPNSPRSVTVEDFYVRGATCQPLELAEGKSIGTEWVVQSCARQRDDGPVLFALEASNQMGSAVQRAAPLRELQSSPDAQSVLVPRWTTAPQITSADGDGLLNCVCPRFESSLDRRVHEIAPFGTKVRLTNSCAGAMTLLLQKNETEDFDSPPTERVPGRTYALVRLLGGQTLEADIAWSTSVPLFYMSCPAEQ